MLKKILYLFFLSILLVSCYPRTVDGSGAVDRSKKVLGFKPVYEDEVLAKKVSYSSSAQSFVPITGNIYAYRNYIFQVVPGRGFHVIDNTIPDSAKRIGFVTVNGCSQISIKEDNIYTNSYDDLVVLKFSGTTVSELSRLKGVFVEYKYASPISEPPFSGYYECPKYDKLIVGWIRDSVNQYCYKN